MDADRTNLLLKAIVTALHTTAHEPSQLDPKLVERIMNRCLGSQLAVSQTSAQISEALSNPLRVDRLARLVDDQLTAAQVYAISAAVVDQTNPRGRVYLDDLAEWLMLDASVYRPIRAHAATPRLGIAA